MHTLARLNSGHACRSSSQVPQFCTPRFTFPPCSLAPSPSSLPPPPFPLPTPLSPLPGPRAASHRSLQAGPPVCRGGYRVPVSAPSPPLCPLLPQAVCPVRWCTRPQVAVWCPDSLQLSTDVFNVEAFLVNTGCVVRGPPVPIPCPRALPALAPPLGGATASSLPLSPLCSYRATKQARGVLRHCR
jgi:hypothetical protein